MSGDELDRREAFARGEHSARWEEQRRVNETVQERLRRHDNLLSALERRVIFISGGASAVGAILGPWVSQLFT